MVPKASVTSRNIATNSQQTVTSGSSGTYLIPELSPGDYKVTVKAEGFRVAEIGPFAVSVGQTTNVNLALELGTSTQTIEVSAAAPLVSTNSGINTTFSHMEVQELPSAGGDLTNIAETAPGTVMNNTGGYGNFTTYGLPATSNLFTINGENDMDPYFNINNSGASNLNIGSNEIQEATVTSNAYAGEYGQLAGAQVTMITKSGTNQFHGNAQYWWNGRAVNANDWMNNNFTPITPLSFSNANQWADSAGGPILKNRTFFFVDNEGMRFLLPNNFHNSIPTPEFATAVQNNVAALQPNEASTYQQLFSIYASSPGASNAVPRTPSAACAAVKIPGFAPGTPCFADASASGTLLGWEWILAARVDQKISSRDQAYFRYRGDHGLQPTTLSSINTAFNALSSQPAWDVQANETHIFGPTMTNSFMATLSHYVAQFQQDEAKALATFPYSMTFSGQTSLTNFGGEQSFPQGRNITQYQFIDDLSWVRGKHNLKFGANFRRYDVSDHNFFYNNPRINVSNLQQFANGKQQYYRRALNFSSDVPIAMWGVGFYGQDEWNLKSNLKLTLALRAEKNSNPVCQNNCFANFVGPWASLPSVQAGTNAGNIPYNQDIKTGLHQAYQGVDAIDLAPRFGFSWSPRGNNSLVISGGYGIFYDNAPAGLVDNLLANPPVAVRITVQPSGGGLGFDTTSAGLAAAWSASANAFSSGFAGGQTYTQIYNALLPLGVNFAAPNFTSINGTVQSPLWQEWNFQVQQGFGKSSALIVNYVGNHGSRIPYSNPWANTYDPYGLYGTLLPGAPPVPNYGAITQWQSGAISNYDGVTISLRVRSSRGFTAHLNYTWSHNLDEASNGGVFTYGDSILGQLNPSSLRAGNYGNSDYDIRHLFSADYVFNPEFHFSSMFARQALNGWQFSGKIFWRSGLPFSITDGNWSGALPNGAETIMAQPIPGVTLQSPCGKSNATATGDPTVPGCLNPAGVIDSGSNSFSGYSAFSGQVRNQFHGPRYFDADMSLFKTFRIRESMKLGIGAMAFNVFNHPNFGNPNSGFVTGDTTFGQISGMMFTPTSPYGAFFGFDSSPRVVQLSAKFEF